MSTPLFPSESWEDGDLQPDVVVNDNARRLEVFGMPALGFAATEPAADDGEIYVLSDAWGGGSTGDVAYYFDGAWTFWTPFEGLLKEIGGTLYRYGGSGGWEVYVVGSPAWGGIGGTLSAQTDLAAALGDVSIVTEASAFTAVPATHKGRDRWIRAGGSVTFDSAESYTAGMVFNIRATAGISLVEDGVTLTPPAGGTLTLSAGMSVSVVMTSSTTADVVGQTVAA